MRRQKSPGIALPFEFGERGKDKEFDRRQIQKIVCNIKDSEM